MDIQINFDRLKIDIQALSEIGKNPQGGVSRPSFSKPDLEAREWLKGKIREADLSLRQDGAGNIFGRLEREGKTVMAGSHIDSVINGGMFDGSIGVLSALECLRRIKEENLSLLRSLEVASFTDEEGNLVGDFLGSRAFVGLLERQKLEQGLTQFGSPLTEILKGTEFTIDSIMEANQQRPEIEAFLELHIEQGEVLETEGKPIGIVDCIAGKQYRWCSFLGEASHSGTTPFELRRDAFLGLADFALKSTQYVATQHYGSRLTIGKVAVSPGTFTVIPARADFSLDFRSTSTETLEEIKKYVLKLGEDIASTRGLGFSSLLMDKTEPVVPSAKIIDLMKEEANKLGYPFISLPSGAGHDAQILASVTDVGMIFIPCEDGISHSPDEKINWEDLEKGANLLLQVLIRLAQ
jgi:N-carbamoyl-L-amino-acid hydrolase